MGLNGFWKPSKYLNLKESAPEDDQEECIPEEDEASQCETEGDKPKIAYGSKIVVKILWKISLSSFIVESSYKISVFFVIFQRILKNGLLFLIQRPHQSWLGWAEIFQKFRCSKFVCSREFLKHNETCRVERLRLIFRRFATFENFGKNLKTVLIRKLWFRKNDIY